MSGAGLRNWRGEIVEAKATPSAGDRDKGGYEADAVGSRSAAPVTPLPLNARDLASEERRPSQQKVLRKDEFGRDVEVVVDEKRRKKSEGERMEDRKKEKKHKHKHKSRKHCRSRRSKSPSAQGQFVGTPPPPDPFRPQLDETRYGRSQRHQRERSNDPQTQKPLVPTTNRETLFRIILRISKMSRQCKEEISSLDGELAVIHGILASGDIDDWKVESRVWTLCREVLLEQLVGNPNSLDRAHEAIVFMLNHSEVRLQLFGAQAAAVCLAELFEVPMAELLVWKDIRGDDGEQLAEFLLGDDAHQSHLALWFYQRGWYRPLSPRKQSEQTGADRALNDVEHSVETAARDYVPELQVQTRVGENADDAEEMDILEAQREHHLRIQLQKHFAQFRYVSAATASSDSCK
ncbi:hypothetical protein KRP22_000236 [Phytophthora ramorum]|nr:hypothetical protein KRP22_12182 [Phytophthora ramorum]